MFLPEFWLLEAPQSSREGCHPRGGTSSTIKTLQANLANGWAEAASTAAAGNWGCRAWINPCRAPWCHSQVALNVSSSFKSTEALVHDAAPAPQSSPRKAWSPSCQTFVKEALNTGGETRTSERKGPWRCWSDHDKGLTATAVGDVSRAVGVHRICPAFPSPGKHRSNTAVIPIPQTRMGLHRALWTTSRNRLPEGQQGTVNRIHERHALNEEQHTNREQFPWVLQAGGRAELPIFLSPCRPHSKAEPINLGDPRPGHGFASFCAVLSLFHPSWWRQHPCTLSLQPSLLFLANLSCVILQSHRSMLCLCFGVCKTQLRISTTVKQLEQLRWGHELFLPTQKDAAGRTKFHFAVSSGYAQSWCFLFYQAFTETFWTFWNLIYLLFLTT